MASQRQAYLAIIVAVIEAINNAVPCMHRGDDITAAWIMTRALQQLISFRGQTWLNATTLLSRPHIRREESMRRTVPVPPPPIPREAEEAKIGRSDGRGGDPLPCVETPRPLPRRELLIQSIRIRHAPPLEEDLPVALYNCVVTLQLNASPDPTPPPPRSVAEDYSWGEWQLHVVQIALLYNLGLANHRWSLATGSSSVISVAMDFYQQACSWLHHDIEAVLQSVALMRVSAAIVYHMAIILGEYGQGELARAMQRQLYSLISSLRHLREDAMVQDPDMAFFFINLALAGLHGHHLAPAA